jgi:hypothetical protein
MAQEKRDVFLRKLEDFSSKGRMREADYAALEKVGNRFIELEQARDSGRTPRNDAGIVFPSREAQLRVPLPRHMDGSHLPRELKAAREAGREYTQALDRLYSYDLVRRNCVTEIFSVINHALAQRVQTADGRGKPRVIETADAVRKESERQLGGYIDTLQGLSFIPFLSAREVKTTYAVVSNREQPSYRKARIAEMSREESPLMVSIRESNTITSTVYRPAPGDSMFLFFTDDALLLRPLLGAFNLFTGIGESLAGIATMPVAGPDRFLSGTKGVLFSLPELVFVNLRKGSVAYVEKSALK